VPGTTEFHHEITNPCFPQADPVFHDATALHTAVDRLDPQPTLVERLVRHVLLPRELLPQIEINSIEWTKEKRQNIGCSPQ
jgi:hypothetical protein